MRAVEERELHDGPAAGAGAVAVDLAILSLQEDELHVLLSLRDHPPYERYWALVGERKRPRLSLDAQAAALFCSLELGKAGLIEQLRTFDRPEERDASGSITVPGRDPRGDVVSVAYLVLVRGGGLGRPSLGLAWHPVRQLPEQIGFDHRVIIDHAVRRLRGKIRYSSVGFALLPEEFTLPELHRLYEQILGRTLHRANFQRDVLRSGAVQPTGERSLQGRGRPAHLYRFRDRSFGLLEDPEGFE